jgi:hypothetical protein
LRRAVSCPHKPDVFRFALHLRDCLAF